MLGTLKSDKLMLIGILPINIAINIAILMGNIDGQCYKIVHKRIAGLTVIIICYSYFYVNCKY